MRTDTILSPQALLNDLPNPYLNPNPNLNPNLSLTLILIVTLILTLTLTLILRNPDPSGPTIEKAKAKSVGPHNVDS